MKNKVKFTLSGVLIVSLVSVFSGCTVVLDKNKDVEVTKAIESINYEADEENEVYYNQGENLVEMQITQAKAFKDGYAYLILEDSRGTEYNAITDKEGNITFFQEKSVRGDFHNSKDGYFYFEKLVGYKREGISCIKYNGEEIYKIEFNETENTSSYRVEDWGEDGTVVVSREITGFDVSRKEFLWIGAKGDVLIDWTENEEEIKKIYEKNVSDSLVLNGDDWSLYDPTQSRKIAEVNVPESSKGRPMSCTPFKNGKAVLFIKESKDQNYFTVINEKGEVLFEPKLNEGYGNQFFTGIIWDGVTLMKVPQSAGGERFSYATFYDLDGNVILEVDYRNTDKYREYEIESSFAEGLVPVSIDTDEYLKYYYCYLKIDGTYLFENGTVSVDFG